MIEIILIIQFAFLVFLGLGYILMGKNALTFLKLTLYRKKGAWYVQRYNSTRVGINYGKYVRNHVWPKKEGESDSFETKIKVTKNQEIDTGEPVIFLREGLGINLDPFDGLNPGDGEKSLQTNNRLAWNEGLLTGRKELEKKDDLKNVMMLGLGIIAILSLGALAFSYLNNEVLTEIINFLQSLETYRPAVEQAIKGTMEVG